MLHIQTQSNSIIYTQTQQFLSSNCAKGNIGITGKVLKQNNTGLYFEEIIKGCLTNIVPTELYLKLNSFTYKPDIETKKAVISCKIQEGPGTAYEKIVLESMDLEHISTQTNKRVVLICSDYSWITYFNKLEPYLKKILYQVDFVTESYFRRNLYLYD